MKILDEDYSEKLYHREAEEWMLGALLSKEGSQFINVGGISEDMFLVEQHKVILAAIFESHNSHGYTDAVSVATILRDKKKLNRIGGVDTLYDLISHMVTVDEQSFEYYRNILNDKRVRRELNQIGGIAAAASKDTEKDPEELLSGIQSSIISLSRETTSSHTYETMPSIAQLYGQILDPRKGRGLMTSLWELDYVTNGLHKGDLIVVGARASMGKTALVLNIAQNIAIEQNLPVLIFSLEMSYQRLHMRMISIESGIPYTNLQKGNYGDVKPLHQALNRLAYAPILINEKRNLTPEQLILEARGVKHNHPGLALIIVDYLQLLRGSNKVKGGTKEAEVSKASELLKELAWELDTPVLATAQLNREVERRTSKRPQLSDIRSSGAIEQDADLVGLLYREDYYDDDDGNGSDTVMTLLDIKKNRNGPVGPIQLTFDKPCMRFRNRLVVENT